MIYPVSKLRHLRVRATLQYSLHAPNDCCNPCRGPSDSMLSEAFAESLDQHQARHRLVDASLEASGRRLPRVMYVPVAALELAFDRVHRSPAR